MALSDVAIKKAKAGEQAYSMSDGNGLYLWVTPAGGKLWRWGYRFNGQRKLMTFGQYPDVPLADARSRHDDARKLLAKGMDPMAERKREKAARQVAEAHSFEAVANAWHDHWKHSKSARHADSVKRRLKADILPRLGNRPIAEIKPTELIAMVNAIQARGARDIAKRALETTGQIFRYAIARDITDRNTAKDITPRDILKSVAKVNYARIDARELPDLLKSIEDYQGTPITRLAMKLLALTFVRTSELIEAPWIEFDLQNARWNIPAERMKAKNPHIVPLSKQALELLERLKRLTGDGLLLFPGDHDKHKSMSNNTILKALERMGYKGKMTGHGFRGLASTILHEQGYAHEHIELQLAHAPRNAVSAAYNHALYLKPRAVMMQEWADYLETSLRSREAPFLVA